MGNIHILSESLRNQIAAGEVVERPASVVKELMENALDAEARHIDIEIENGGSKKIAVRDDGKGMDEADAAMALKRYATSKIARSDDLFALHSFGFRGEALASIAAVSHVTLTTRQEAIVHGTQVMAKSGEQKKVSAPVGTSVVVTDLFYNVPARKKFLKKEATENAHIAEMVQNFTLAHPETAFRLVTGTRIILDTSAYSAEDALLKRISSVFGREFTANLLPIHFLGSSLQISGYISHPHVHRRNRKNQRLFVNKRPITDRLISAAISQAYESLVPKGFFPDVFLFLEIAPDLVDVNVHPRKSAVKFLQEKEIFSAVRGALRNALEETTKIAGRGKDGAVGDSRRFSNVRGERKTSSSTWTLHSPNTSTDTFQKPRVERMQTAIGFSRPSFINPEKMKEICKNTSPHETPKDSRIIGQIRNSFLLVETEDGLFIIDQHAAHERVRYERLMQSVREKKPRAQKLLMPQVLEISPAEKETLEVHRKAFEELGFEIQEFSNKEVSLYAVPAGTEKVDFSENLQNLLHDLEQYLPEEGRTVSKAAERIATFAACRGAIKFGDKLTHEEMEQLLRDLEKSPGGFACAHGRPVWMKVGYEEMERECGR